jgi:hypothetical protein
MTGAGILACQYSGRAPNDLFERSMPRDVSVCSRYVRWVELVMSDPKMEPPPTAVSVANDPLQCQNQPRKTSIVGWAILCKVKTTKWKVHFTFTRV